MATDPVISAKGLVKEFGDFRALNELDLTIQKGEVHGFLGPNGAGKSTTIRILLGLMRATDGQVAVLGQDPWANATELHRRIAYIPGEVNLWANLTGGEVIDFFLRLRTHPQVSRKAELLERFQLDPHKKCRTYSKGNRQKVAIVAALAAEADLYIMDEPTSGLDPLMEATFQECVRELKAQGKTILLSSHILAEAEALCDRITIIRQGKDVESGTLTELRHLTHLSVEVTTAKPLTGIQEQAGVHDYQGQGPHATFQVEPDALNDVLKKLATFGVQNLISNPPSLEQLFMRHYNEHEELQAQVNRKRD